MAESSYYATQGNKYRTSMYPNFSGGTTDESGNLVQTPYVDNVSALTPTKKAAAAPQTIADQTPDSPSMFQQAAGMAAPVVAGQFGMGMDTALEGGASLGNSMVAGGDSVANMFSTEGMGKSFASGVDSVSNSISSLFGGEAAAAAAPAAGTAFSGAAAQGAANTTAQFLGENAGTSLASSVSPSMFAGEGASALTGAATSSAAPVVAAGVGDAAGSAAGSTAGTAAGETTSGAASSMAGMVAPFTMGIGTFVGGLIMGQSVGKALTSGAIVGTFAAIGSVIPGVGTVIGGIIGGFVSLFSDSIICHDLYRRGLFPEYASQRVPFLAYRDQKLTDTHYRGYLVFAKPYVSLMQKEGWVGKFFTNAALPIVKGYVAYGCEVMSGPKKKPCAMRRALSFMGESIMYMIGLFVKRTAQEILMQHQQENAI